MKILVTGGAGFIGSHIVDAYLADGHDVAVLDNLSTGLKENLNPAVTLFEVDLCNQTEVANVLHSFRPEVINHQAAHLSVSDSVIRPQFNAETNIIGFLNLMESAKDSVKRVIVASTGGALYGDTDRIPTEEVEPIDPISPYGISKRAMELYLHYYQVQYQIDWVSLRYANVYGPRQNPKGETGVIAVFLSAMGSGKVPTIFGDGTQTRDYVFVEDLVRAHVVALTAGVGAYNIGTGVETNVNEVYATLKEALSFNQAAQYSEARPGEQKRSALSYARAQHDLNWQPTTMLQDGIKKTVAWYQEKGKG